MKKIDRIGEEKINSFGSKMIIRGYRNNRDIDVYFPEYNWTFKHAEYKTFKNGNIKCPYEPRVFGMGYIQVKESIRLKKMAKIQMNIKYITIC